MLVDDARMKKLSSILALAVIGCSGPGDLDGGVPRDSGGGSVDAGPPAPACTVPAPFDEGLTYERMLYVSPTGSPGGDGSMGDPLDTIEGAAALATPGTQVLVGAGTYAPFRLDGVTGEEGRPIAFVADGDVIIDAGGAGTVVGMTDPAWVVFEGFTLRGAGVHGMNIDDGGSYDTPAHHLVLRGVTVPGAGSGGNNDCLKMSGVDDFWVVDSDVSGCDMGEAIDMVGCHRGIIAANHFHDVVQNGVQTKGGSADVLIHGNLFSRIPGRAVNAGGSTGLEFFRPIDAPHEAARIRAVANVFVDGGAMSGAAIAYVGCDGCVAANNTIIRPQTWVVRILQESTDARFVPSRDGLFVNNLIVVDTADIRAWVNVGGNTAPETFVFGNNLWWALDQGAAWSGPSIDGSIPAELSSIIQEDPLLADLGGGDVRPMAGSPVGGAGRALPFPQPPDRDGRCYAEPLAIGAYELP